MRLSRSASFGLAALLLAGCGGPKPDASTTVTVTNGGPATDKPTAAADQADMFAYLKDGTKIVETTKQTRFKVASKQVGAPSTPSAPETVEVLETTTVKKVKSGPEGTLYALEVKTESGPKPYTRYQLVTPAGLFDADAKGAKRTEVPTIPANLKVGDKWTDKKGDFDLTATVEAYEDVEVPAGKFKAYRLLMNAHGETARIWYAPLGGVVKTERTIDGKPTTDVVKEITVGK